MSLEEHPQFPEFLQGKLLSNGPLWMQGGVFVVVGVGGGGSGCVVVLAEVAVVA